MVSAATKLKIMNVVGARPNFMKIAPVHRRMEMTSSIEPILIHTGQHYDEKMSDIFFKELEMPQPDRYLGVGSGTHAQQTASVMTGIEDLMIEYKPDLVLVVGDVNSTLAASLVACKLHIPVAHVEAGLRSFDRTMPEEINRVLTDSIAEYLFITEQSAQINLLNEGITPEKIHFVGNVMIDSLLYFKAKAAASTILNQLNLNSSPYALVTLHRPSNVDTKDNIQKILLVLHEIQKHVAVVFPIHPRTRKMICQLSMEKLISSMPNLQLIDPLGYLDFLHLMTKAYFILTDSGGIQEETTVLGVPCLTLRENTERPCTVEIGTNIIVGTDTRRIIDESLNIIGGNQKKGTVPPLWDGKAAERIVGILEKVIS